MKKQTEIWVVVTTYNEKENIPALIPQILEKDDRLKVLVVDDSSPDGTGKIVDKLKSKYKNRLDIIHRNTRGVGTALRDGFKEVLKRGADIVIQMDADFSHNPFYLPDFIKELENGSDVVIGSRYAEGGGIASRSLIRNSISKIANFYNHLFLGMWNLSDTATGYKGYKSGVLSSIDLNSMLSSGYSIGIENLYRISKKGFIVKEIPILFSDRNAGNSKMGVPEILKYMFTVIRIRITR